GAKGRGGHRLSAGAMARTGGPMFAVTIETLPGYRVVRVVGEVVGATARPRNTYESGVKALTGEPNPGAPRALARWREEAVSQMLQAAYRRGANAVVGIRFDLW